MSLVKTQEQLNLSGIPRSVIAVIVIYPFLRVFLHATRRSRMNAQLFPTFLPKVSLLFLPLTARLVVAVHPAFG